MVRWVSKTRWPLWKNVPHPPPAHRGEGWQEVNGWPSCRCCGGYTASSSPDCRTAGDGVSAPWDARVGMTPWVGVGLNRLCARMGGVHAPVHRSAKFGNCTAPEIFTPGEMPCVGNCLAPDTGQSVWKTWVGGRGGGDNMGIHYPQKPGFRIWVKFGMCVCVQVYMCMCVYI